MSKNTSFSLGDAFHQFIAAQVADGHYSTASEVVRAALRLLQEQEEEIAYVRAALIEGENSGLGKPFDFDAFIAERHAEIADRK